MNDTAVTKKKSPFIAFLMLLVIGLLLFTLNFVWQIISAAGATASTQAANEIASKLWHSDAKAVQLDDYIADNQVSQNIIDKKQRVMLEPELIEFTAVLQSEITKSKTDLVYDALGLWGIEPMPEVGFATFIRSPQGQVLGVYLENAVAGYLNNNVSPEITVQLQALRLYNYAKGPRLLLIGVKPLAANEVATGE